MQKFTRLLYYDGHTKQYFKTEFHKIDFLSYIQVEKYLTKVNPGFPKQHSLSDHLLKQYQKHP